MNLKYNQYGFIALFLASISLCLVFFVDYFSKISINTGDAFLQYIFIILELFQVNSRENIQYFMWEADFFPFTEYNIIFLATAFSTIFSILSHILSLLARYKNENSLVYASALILGNSAIGITNINLSLSLFMIVIFIEYKYLMQ